MIKVIRIGEFLIVGQVDDETLLGINTIVKNPRVIQLNDKGQLILTPFIGEPKEMTLATGKMTFGYTLTDERMIASYREAVSGLVMAKNNVIDIGGRK
jgi:hypothetical protein